MNLRPLIVVADADRDTRELYRACFDLSGYRTSEAASGAEAIALTRRLRPDVLLTDLALPDLDGCAVASQVRDDSRTRDVRVFLITAYLSPGLDRRAENAGIARLLFKPCHPRTLLREIERVLGRRTDQLRAS